MSQYDPPNDYYCPITGELMINPFMDNDGHSYEEEAIKKWLKTKQISPLTRRPLILTDLRRNIALKNSIDDIREKISNDKLKIRSRICDKENEPFIDSFLKIKLNTYYDNEKIFVNIAMPEIKVRPSVDIALCIDVSGSMGADAPIKGDDGREVSYGISVLSLTICAAKTILNSLNENDKISIITYTNTSSILVDNWCVTPENQTLIESMLDELRHLSTTNIWAGLKTSLDILRTKSPTNRMKGVFLLTDGVPNVEPPQGHETVLKKYFEKYTDFDCMINSYGFGYNLNSELLQNISDISCGDGFAYIPDSSLLGNIFIHGLSNFLTTAYVNPKLTIKLNEYVTFEDGSNEKVFKINSLKYGQDKNLIIDIKNVKNIDDFDLVELGIANLSVNNISFNNIINDYNKLNEDEYYNQLYRKKAIQCINECITHMKFNEKKLVNELITCFINDIKKNKVKTTIPDVLTTTNYITNIIFDFEGQIKEALNMTRDGDKEDWFGKWGIHYLRSLTDAYSNEICNNFKDKGVSNFGGSLFQSLRDNISDIFDKIPPPAKKKYNINYQRGHITSVGSLPVLQSMASYNFSGGGCCAAGSHIEMADGTHKKVENVYKGDRVITVDLLNQNKKYSTSIIECVVNTECHNGKEKMVVLDNLRITPYHPIIINNKWVFPCDIKEPHEIKCNNMFTFVVENKRSVIVDKFPFATYGHNLQGEVISHNYFGTDSVINDLKKIPLYKLGMIFLRKNMFERGENGEVNRITFKCDIHNMLHKLYFSNM